VIKVCANPDTYQQLADDMDINAGRILSGEATLAQVGREIVDLVVQVANGSPSRSEDLGHQEFILTYKQFEPAGPGCFPLRAA
jgi:altronate hydrolase